MAVDRSKYYGYQQNFDKEHYKPLRIRLSYAEDEDIISFLEIAKQDKSINALVKEGLRLVMEKNSTK